MEVIKSRFLIYVDFSYRIHILHLAVHNTVVMPARPFGHVNISVFIDWKQKTSKEMNIC